MYVPFSLFLAFYLYDRSRGYETLAIWKFLVCSIVDVHGTQFIVFAYTKTSVTSVMLLEDSTILFAVLLRLLCAHTSEVVFS